MKRNDIPILLATAAFSFLFYKQTEGVNYFAFSLVLTLLLIIRDISLLSSRTFLAAAAGYITASFCLFWYGTTLPFVATMISMLLLAGVSFDRESSIFIAGFHSVLSLLAVPVYMLIDMTESMLRSGRTEGTGVFKKAILAVVPVIIFFIFIGIYSSGNPIFDHFVSYINFDFISIGWCFFTLWGFFFCYAFFKQHTIKIVTAKDHGTGDTLPVITAEDHSKGVFAHLLSVSSEVYTGVLLLSLLNVLLFVVNGLDIFYLGVLRTMPAGITASQYVHNGTNSLIVSIIFAVAIMLFYFRGYLNYYEGNKWLKNLAYLWIIQNIVLVLSTAYRNGMYIGNYGLTDKRIGVYVYLTLCVAGLITTFIKIYKVKNTWFLFRKNGWIGYAFLICACPFDWDSIITNYDIANFQKDRKMEIDQRYLASLSHTNLATLFQYYIVEKKKLKADVDAREESSSSSLRGAMSLGGKVYYSEIEQMIWKKYKDLNTRYADHKIQSHCMSKSDNLHAVERMIRDNNLVCPDLDK